jgi:hypothetical protein
MNFLRVRSASVDSRDNPGPTDANILQKIIVQFEKTPYGLTIRPAGIGTS